MAIQNEGRRLARSASLRPQSDLWLVGWLLAWLLGKTSHTSYLLAYEDGTGCSETSGYKIQTSGNYPEESIQRLKLIFFYAGI